MSSSHGALKLVQKSLGIIHNIEIRHLIENLLQNLPLHHSEPIRMSALGAALTASLAALVRR
jgi:hypothetical protein